MSMPYKQIALNKLHYTINGAIRHATAWRSGPWVLFNEHHYHRGYEHRFRMLPERIRARRRNEGRGYEFSVHYEDQVDPILLVSNGALAAMLFKTILVRMNMATGFGTPLAWALVSRELGWDCGDNDHLIGFEQGREWLRKHREAF